MPIALVGLSFRTAPIALRERFSLTPRALGAALARHAGGEAEIAVLSTCNRFEVYAADTNGTSETASLAAQAFLSAVHHSEPDITPHLFTMSGDEAVEHLFSVAAGIDSMVIGEAQILGQVGDALQLALDHGTVGRQLSSMLRHAIMAGRRVRNETAIGQGAASVSHAAVLLARQQFGDLAGKHVLLVGAGKMAELAAHALADHAVGAVRVLNRDANRAAQVATTLGGEAANWDDLPDALAWADVVISSTGAPHTVIHAPEVSVAMQSRPERPLVMVDVAVPRDVDRVVGQLKSVALADIDDLQAVVTDGIRDRESFIPEARAIVTSEVAAFAHWLTTLDVTPTIAGLRDQAERIRDGELQKALRRLSGLSPQERRAVEAMSVAIVNKILHAPTVTLKRHAADGRFVQVARDLFDLGAVEADGTETRISNR